MKIGLYGISGTYNYGCEAIVRGGFSFFKNAFPNSEICYFSFCFEYDSKRLKDLDIKIIPVSIKTSAFKRIINKILRFFHFKRQFLMFDDIRKFYSLDLLVSVGGDLYTIPKIERQKKKYEYHNGLVDLFYCLKRRGIKFLIYGASIGPFGQYTRAIKYYRDALSKANHIILREKNSFDYLKTIGVSNTIVLPDPAFNVFDFDIKEYDPEGPIGINLSFLALMENLNQSDYQKAIFSMKAFVEKMHKKYQKKIVFIPHVVFGDKERDNDYLFLKRIYDLLDDEIKNNVGFCDYSGGFLGVKKSLKKCSLVIGSRMHCCVNAIHEAIPTLFIGYSIKAEGMCAFVYGNNDFIVSVEELSGESLEMVDKLYSSRMFVHNYLKKRNAEIKSEIDDCYKDVQTIINN